ncbi:MAG TPA: hypothetical protein VGJ45_05260 [Pseudonocardiaceae bacterium]
MRRLGPVVGIAVLALLVADCGGHSTGSAQNQPAVAIAPTSTTAPDLPNVHLPAGAVPVAGAKVDARALPAGYPRLVWTEGNGGVVGFFAEQGACTTASASVIGETDLAVTVRLVITQPASTKPCPQYLLNKEMTVNLDRPLGSRTVIMQAAIERG